MLRPSTLLGAGVLVLAAVSMVESQYLPEWDSIDSRPLPQWFDDAKLGIFIHWGVFSVPAASNNWFGEEWFEWAWKSGQNYPGDGGTPGPGPGSPLLVEFMEKNYPNHTYADLAQYFKAEFYNPDSWAELFERAGAKYAVLTTKHHDGYCLWPTAVSPGWNSAEVGPMRDLVGDYAAAMRRKNIRVGFYHSYTDWFHPLWLAEKRNGWTTNEFVTTKTDPELKELVNEYHPDLLWSDGEWAPEDYWQCKEFLAWLYNDSPSKDEVIVNDRWAWDTVNEHGGYWSGADRQNPGIVLPHKWERCDSLDKYSWGYRRDTRVENYLTPEEMVRFLVETVSCGGNLLLNVAPNQDGIIPMIEQERLIQLGDWMRMNGEAIYSSVPYTVQEDVASAGTWYTANRNGTNFYAMVTRIPNTTNSIHLGSIPFTGSLNIQLLGNDATLNYEFANPGIRVHLPPREQINGKYAYTLKFTR